MNTKTVLFTLAALGAGYFVFRQRSDSSAPLTRATTFHYAFEGVSQNFTSDELERFARSVEDQTAAFGVEFNELPSGDVLFSFTLPAGATPPPRVLRIGNVVARRESALPAIEQ